ncbi:MAG: flagellar export chaperone FlgN [Oscillospiraceae bacterium]
MDSRYNEYISFLSKYRDELSSYLESECEKRRALLGSDFLRLEKMLKVQQAETMKFRELESKRAKLQSKLGLPGVKVAELLKTIDDPETHRSVEALFAEIAAYAEQIQEQNRQSLELAETNLKIIDLVRGGSAAEARSSYYGPENSRRTVYSAGEAFEETV